MRILFILGLSDARTIEVSGFAADGSIVYNWNGNAAFHHYVDAPAADRTHMFIAWHAEPPRHIDRPDIIVNCISDPDIAGRSLAVASDRVQLLREKWPGLSVFNDPAKVAATTRARIWQDYNTLPGLHMPKVARLRPAGTAHALALAAEAGIGFPFLIRPCGAHQGRGLQRIDGPADKDKLERYAWDGSDYYVTQFADTRGRDGLYRKARLVMLGGALLPRHFMTGTDWLVSDEHDGYMAAHPETRAAEKDFLDNYEKKIDPRALASLREIYARSGLDYLGFDLALRDDGTLQVFEINAAQNAFGPLDEKTFPYMKAPRADIIAALNATVRRKAG